MAGIYPRCLTTLDVGKKPSSGDSWESFKILFHRFADLPSAVGQMTRSPKFTCNGHDWCLRLYPGGDVHASAGYTSVYLEHCSEGYATASYEISVLDKHQRKANIMSTSSHFSCGETWGWKDFYPQTFIMENILDDEGTLAIVASIKRDAVPPFVPSNPVRGMITSMFLDEESADVCFEVSDVDANADDRDDAASSPVTFHAHRLILKACAPMLASIFGPDDENDKIATASITDVKASIFRHMLYYVYGGSVTDGEMKIHAKDLISATNKYSIVNLKLEAEAAYVKSTVITMENAIENLLFADRLSLALLKETVMDFLAKHHVEASRSLSFPDIPCDVMKDLLVAFGRKTRDGANASSDDDLSTMRVSELRWKLAELGLDVDGSREAMIEALGANAQESADANEEDDDLLQEE
jgi:speckle-type POZ protein